METRRDLDSVLRFLPLVLRSSSLCWPSQVVEALKALSQGPDVSRVRSGKVLFDAILDLRESLGLSSESLVSGASAGFALFFDKVFVFPCILLCQDLSSSVAGIGLRVKRNQILMPEIDIYFLPLFGQLISRTHSRVWFEEIVPEMARLLVRLPSLLEAHYLKSDELLGEGNNGLRIMDPQEPGVVFLSQVRLPIQPNHCV